jgi:hypothetical protein
MCQIMPVRRRLRDSEAPGGSVRAVRLGCGGCSSTVLAFIAIAALVALAGWAVTHTLQAPDVEAPRFTREDGVRAQQKILDLALHRVRSGTVLFSEAEVNAFVSRHLDPTELPVRDPTIRLRDGDILEIVGTVALGRLVRESPVGALADMLPAGWLARPLWLSIAARAVMSREPRHTLRLEPRRLLLGRQRVPAFMLRLMLDPSTLRLMRIALPAEIQTLRIERGRVVIQQATSPPSRT